MIIKKKKLIKKLERIIEGNTSRLPNNEEIMNKINEVIDIINKEICLNHIDNGTEDFE
jgi:sugar-specific transcriptional regulator TrmB